MRSQTRSRIAANAAAATLCATSWAWSGRAGASSAPEGKTSSLSWVELPGAEGCGGASILAKAVEDRLGRHALVSPAQADLSIEGHVERTSDPARWHSVVVVRDPAGTVLGTREFESAEARCDDLRASLALAIALMIDPDAVQRSAAAASAPPTPPAPLPPPEQVVAAPARERAAPPAAPRRSLKIQPSAAAALGFQVLPSLASGVRVSVDISPAHFWTFEVYGGAWAPQTRTDGSVSTRFTLAYAGAALCPLRIENAWVATFALCAGVEVGFMSTFSEVLAAQERTTPMADGIAEAELAFPLLGPLQAQLGARLGLGPARQFSYDVATNGETSRAAPLFERAVATAAWDVGLGVVLP